MAGQAANHGGHCMSSNSRPTNGCMYVRILTTIVPQTTFFVSIDSMLYGYATSASPVDSSAWTNTELVKSATLGGSIILHVCACECTDVVHRMVAHTCYLFTAILAYLASFVLIRYRLDDAEQQVQADEGLDTRTDTMPRKLATKDQVSTTSTPLQQSTAARRQAVFATSQDFRALVSVYQIKPFACVQRKPHAPKANPEAPSDTDDGDAAALRTLQSMVKTLTRCHTVVAIMTNVGFVLALVGTIAYFWTALPVALGSFASVCLGACLVAGVFAVM